MTKTKFISLKELSFQVILHLVVMFFFIYDRQEEGIEAYRIVYFLTYIVAGVLVSYVLLPRFFYTKRYVLFFFYFALIIAANILVEELVLEQIYFPDTRGTRFPGVIFSLMGVLPIITILSGFKFAWDALTKQREVEELRATVRESELEFLKSQINPHFLFNNLNNLYAYAIENSPKTPTIILELSGVLRYMLYECKAQFVPLKKEVEQLKNFTQLSELQIEDRGYVQFETKNIQPNYQIAPLIMVVFIENAFKHSQASQADDIFIEIQLELSRNGQLHFVCRNNYQAVTNTQNLAHGIGLENVKKRLDLLYPDTHTLKIKQTGSVYEVNLKIQLHARAEAFSVDQSADLAALSV
ncbi:MAG: histidine kinase [Bacteroidota bacterium]